MKQLILMICLASTLGGCASVNQSRSPSAQIVDELYQDSQCDNMIYLPTTGAAHNSSGRLVCSR